ncbi:MAG: hypothetical protein P8X39_05215, partial [Desulfofustis sp.]
FLEQQQGSNTYVGLELSGANTGDGCLIISTGCAIRVCGRMLMLPSADINQLLAEENFEEDTGFAFEDIIRAIIAAQVKTFQDPGGNISRVIYKNKQTIVGAPKESEIDCLKDNHAYYQISAEVSMDGVGIGLFSLLLPAFVLLYSSIFKNGVDRFAGLAGDTAGEEESQAAVSRHVGSGLEFDGLQQNNSRLDALASIVSLQAAREISRLLEVPVSIGLVSNTLIDAERMYRSLSKTAHLSACYSLAGSLEEEVIIAVGTKDGAWLGALLADGVHGAVLARLQEASLDADRQEGFAEICDILMDFLIDFMSSESTSDIEVNQKKVFAFEPGEAESFSIERYADRDFWTVILKLSAGALGDAELHLLIPAKVVNLLPLSADAQIEPMETIPEIESAGAERIHETETGDRKKQGHLFETNVLIVGGEKGEGRVIQSQLGKDRVASDVIASTAEIDRAMLEDYSAVILVVDGLNETTLGLAIKIHAASSVPLIVAASRWTQSEVLKALRYGVSDILMTPTRPGEVVEKLKNLAGTVLS